MPAVGKTKQKYIQAFGKEKHGFFVRIPLPGKKTFASKEFGSRQYKQAELLKQARAWRDEKYFALYGHKILNRTVHKRQSNNRATGIPGVRHQIKTVHQRVGDRIYTYQLDYYIAEVWLEPGRDGERSSKSRSKIFSAHEAWRRHRW